MKKIILILTLITLLLASCEQAMIKDKGDIAICDSYKKICESHMLKCDNLPDEEKFRCYVIGNSCHIISNGCYDTHASFETQKILTEQKSLMIEYWQLMEK